MSSSIVHDLSLLKPFESSPNHLWGPYCTVKPVLPSRITPIKQQDGFPSRTTCVTGIPVLRFKVSVKSEILFYTSWLDGRDAVVFHRYQQVCHCPDHMWPWEVCSCADRIHLPLRARIQAQRTADQLHRWATVGKRGYTSFVHPCSEMSAPNIIKWKRSVCLCGLVPWCLTTAQ